ncbi:MAG: methenyltetrahydromethanopterin cyclohydrolase, partial [Planctomycetota bacterium]
TAPVPPPGEDDLLALGRSNDAVLYGARVVLEIQGDDASIEEIGPKVPSSASRDYGEPFIETFRRHDHDFYKVDPLLFSPASVTFRNSETGTELSFGETNVDVLRRSFFPDA